MKAGGSKAKGAQFEREVCVKLSLWITRGRKRDVFWRSAMSGGRATLGGRRGHDLARQAGDICAVAPEGHALTDKYYIECKHLRRSAYRLDLLLLGFGPLALIWKRTVSEARKYGRAPMLIAKQNGSPALALVFSASSMVPEVEADVQAWVRVGKYSIAVYLLDELLKPAPAPIVRRRLASAAWRRHVEETA